MRNLEKISDKYCRHIRHKERIILQIDTIVNIQINDIRRLGHNCGVYILINRSGELYIGSSTNIKNRLKSHRNNRNFGQLESIIIIATENIEKAKDLEITLIKEMKPDLNKQLYNHLDYKLKYVIRNLFKYSKN